MSWANFWKKQCLSAKPSGQGMFTSFPLSYFKHPASNLFRSPEAHRPMSGDQRAPASTPGPRKRGTRAQSTSIRWQAAMGLPWAEAKPRVSGSEEENRWGRMGTVRLSSPTAPRLQLRGAGSTVSLYFPRPLCDSQACSHPAFQNIGWVGWCFF